MGGRISIKTAWALLHSYITVVAAPSLASAAPGWVAAAAEHHVAALPLPTLRLALSLVAAVAHVAAVPVSKMTPAATLATAVAAPVLAALCH